MQQPYSGSLIGALRRHPAFTRPAAALVAVAVLALVAMPSVVAARQAEKREAVQASLEPSERQALGRTIERVRKQLEALAVQLQRPRDERDPAAVAQALETLRTLERELTQMHQRHAARLAARGERLRGKDMPPKILQRHAAAVERYREKMATVLNGLESLQRANGVQARREAASGLLSALPGATAEQGSRGSPAHGERDSAPATFDPNDLPAGGEHKRPEETPAPRTDEAAFETSGLTGAPRARWASHGDFRVDELAGAADPAYRSETTEVRITDAIKAKAAALDHDPVKIHAWVRNNVAWIPSWGATQTADHTLSSRRGNAMDIASLEIALLRASDIPARYAVGTVEVAAERFKNWAGGFDRVENAAEYAASGGIPTKTIVEAGRIARVRMEHVWVEAAVDYFPSRAAVNESADAWIPLDASFKQYKYIEGLDVAKITGLDPKKIAEDFAGSGTIDEQAGFVQGLDPSILANAQQDAQSALEDHINNELADDATVADVIGGRKIEAQSYDTLPASIPNQLVTTGARYDALPKKLQHRLVVGLGTDILGQPKNTVELPWAKANGAKLTLAFTPATQADREALQGLLPDGEITDPSQLPSSIPSSLIKLTPELRLDGEVIQTGAAMKPGQELDFAFTVERKGFAADTSVSPVPAGSYLHLAVAGGSVAPSQLEGLQARIEATKNKLASGSDQQLASLTREDLLGDLFHAGGLAYFGQFDALSQLQARQQDARQNLAPSAGTYGYVPKVTTLFGLPNAIEPGGVSMDLDRVAWTQGAKQSAPTDRRQRNVQAGALSSALEHIVPEQMFSTQDNQAEAVSAVKALSIANREGQKIYRIDQSNRDTALPKLNLGANTMDEIRAALDAGKVVTTHTDKITVPGWKGAGYVILDPDTGAGAWKIGGGQNGGFFEAASLALDIFSINFTFKEALLEVSSRAGKFIAVFAAAIGAITISAKCNDPNTRALALISYLSFLWVITAFFATYTLVLGPLAALFAVVAASIFMNLLKGYLVRRC